MTSQTADASEIRLRCCFSQLLFYQ